VVPTTRDARLSSLAVAGSRNRDIRWKRVLDNQLMGRGRIRIPVLQMIAPATGGG
jgi:hypothetical protein